MHHTSRNRIMADCLTAAGLRSNTKMPERLIKPLPPTQTLEKDGVDHINIWHDADTSIGRFLRHSRTIEFNHSYFGTFRSIEVFWHWLRSAERDDRIRLLEGYQLTAARKGLTYTNKVPNFAAIIMDANWQKIQSNPTPAREFAKTKLPLDCYYYNNRDHEGFRIRLPFANWLVWGFEEIRTALKEQRDPDFTVLLTHPELDLYTGKPKKTEVCEPAIKHSDHTVGDATPAPKEQSSDEETMARCATIVESLCVPSTPTLDPVDVALIEEFIIDNAMGSVKEYTANHHDVTIHLEETTLTMELKTDENICLDAAASACIQGVDELKDALAAEEAVQPTDMSPTESLAFMLEAVDVDTLVDVEEPENLEIAPEEGLDKEEEEEEEKERLRLIALAAEEEAEYQKIEEEEKERLRLIAAAEEEAEYQKIEEEEKERLRLIAAAEEEVRIEETSNAIIQELMQKATDAAQTISIDAITAVSEAVRLSVDGVSVEPQPSVVVENPEQTNLPPDASLTSTVFDAALLQTLNCPLSLNLQAEILTQDKAVLLDFDGDVVTPVTLVSDRGCVGHIEDIDESDTACVNTQTPVSARKQDAEEQIQRVFARIGDAFDAPAPDTTHVDGCDQSQTIMPLEEVTSDTNDTTEETAIDKLIEELQAVTERISVCSDAELPIALNRMSALSTQIRERKLLLLNANPADTL